MNYYTQWPIEELTATHGECEQLEALDSDEIDAIESDYYSQQEQDKEEECHISMDSLGMSWRDFV